MKWYGSVINRLKENKNLDVEKVVGGLLTEFSYSDRHPYEIVEVDNQKSIYVRELGHEKADDIEFSNNWRLYQDKRNPIKHLVYRYNYWYEEYETFTGKKGYNKINVTFGYADYYYDYEF